MYIHLLNIWIRRHWSSHQPAGMQSKVPLTVKPNTINSDGGVGTVLTAEQTAAWTWRWARYVVQVEVKGIRSVVYEGNLTLENNLGA